MAAEATISHTGLAASATKYRKTLLSMPIIGIRETSKHMTVRPGITYKEVVGALSGSFEIAPYSASRKDTSGITITGRELETFLGSVVKEFDPNSVRKTLWASLVSKGEGLKGVDINKQILAYLMKSMSEGLNGAIWSASRSDSGTTTKTLFNGFDTITTTEITAGNISAAKKNLVTFTDEIDSSNAVDTLKSFYRGATAELRDQATKLFVPYSVYDAYVDDYQATVGAAPYNKEFDKLYLEGSRRKCELVPLANKEDSPYIHLSPKSNMLIGVDTLSNTEQVTVEKHAAFVLQFIATYFFGCQFESIDPKRLLVGKFYVAS